MHPACRRFSRRPIACRIPGVKRLSLIVAPALLIAACVEPEVKETPHVESPADVKLAQHRKLQDELMAAHERHLGACDSFEKSKESYLQVLQVEIAAAKAKAGTAQSITSMAEERIRIAKELRAAQKMLDDSLVARAGAAARLLAIEARLWEAEEAAFGGRPAAAARAEQEIKDFRDTETSLHVAQKAQQKTVAQLLEAEFELNATIGEDREARDIADRRLTALRTELQERMTRLIDAARAYDQQSEQIHRKLLKQIADQAKTGKVKQLLAEREKAATSVASSRETLKAAMLKRAEDRAREISHDGEIAAVIDKAFRDAKARDELLAKVRPKRDAASEARVAMQKEEAAMGEVRRKLVTVEADIQALGY
jgi:hypothetical protein